MINKTLNVELIKYFNELETEVGKIKDEIKVLLKDENVTKYVELMSKKESLINKMNACTLIE